VKLEKKQLDMAAAGLRQGCQPYLFMIQCENELHIALARIFHEFEAFICKAFRDAAVLMLPQIPDNAANGRLELARRVKTFMLF